MNRLYALLGYPLSHSFSKAYFEEKFLREGIFNCSFINMELDSLDKLQPIIDIIKSYPCSSKLEQGSSFLERGSENLFSHYSNLKGFCVTIPYKEKIIDYLDQIDTIAKEIGAVNVVKIIVKNNTTILKGYNSDIIGFKKSLLENINTREIKALILGTGGASKAVAYALKELDIEFKYVSRKKKDNDILTYEDINRQILESHRLIINTTPLGMYPNIYDMPDINFSYISKEHIIFDLIYNPEQTMLIKQALIKGAKAINGLDMLSYQAQENWRIWNN